jgi:hypothetical protein
MVALLYGLGCAGLLEVVCGGLDRTDRAKTGFDGPGEVLTARPLHAFNKLLNAAVRPDAKADALLRHRKPAG